MKAELPIIDISGCLADPGRDRREIAAEMDAAAREFGFFHLSGHAVSEQCLRDCFGAASAFFDLPERDKSLIAIENSPCHRGWYAIGGEVLDPVGQKEGDVKEGLKIGNDLPAAHPLVQAGIPLHGPNQWPEGLPDWKDVMQAGYEAFCLTGLELMRCFAVALELDARYFDRWLVRPESEPMATLSPIRYPPLPPGEERLSAAAHTDFGCLTLLAQDGREGLEIRLPDGGWLPVPPLRNTLVVNIGDMLALWSGGRYRSTRHRVRNRTGEIRQSLAFFYDPAYNAPIGSLTGRPAGNPETGPQARTALDHLLEKIGESFDYHKNREFTK